MSDVIPNEGIELLYTRDCPHWPVALQNLQQALRAVGINEEPQCVTIDTMEQAEQYNFFASPTIHVRGQDIDQRARRISRRGLGHGRPYFDQGHAVGVPPLALIVAGLKELY